MILIFHSLLITDISWWTSNFLNCILVKKKNLNIWSKASLYTIIFIFQRYAAVVFSRHFFPLGQTTTHRKVLQALMGELTLERVKSADCSFKLLKNMEQNINFQICKHNCNQSLRWKRAVPPRLLLADRCQRRCSALLSQPLRNICARRRVCCCGWLCQIIRPSLTQRWHGCRLMNESRRRFGLIWMWGSIYLKAASTHTALCLRCCDELGLFIISLFYYMTLSLAVIWMLFSLPLILVNTASISLCPPVRQRFSQQSALFSQTKTEQRSFNEFGYDKLSLAPLIFL